MRKINGVALTEKGALKPAVRDNIKGKDLNAVAEGLGNYGFEVVEDKGCLVLEREDTNGNKVYTTLTLTVSTKHPSDKAERKAKPKAKAEDIVIE